MIHFIHIQERFWYRNYNVELSDDGDMTETLHNNRV